MPSKKLPEIYFIAEGSCLALNEKESVGYVFDPKPEYFEWISACKCSRCNQIIILNGDVFYDHAEDREMGPEYWYFDTQYLNCPNCGQDIYVDLILTEYAYAWDCELELSGAEEIWIDGLKELAEMTAHLDRISLEKETLERETETLKEKIRRIRDHAEIGNIFILIVEGKDDRVVWEQFLKRESVPIDSIDILTYGGGGIDEAIKLASIFRGKVLKRIPHMLIIDSDNKIEGIKNKLKKYGIHEGNVHILREKEIDAYLLDEEAIARVLSIDTQKLKEFIERSKIAPGKELLDAIGKEFIGHPLDSQTKGLIARAVKKIPEEIHHIISEIKGALSSKEEYYFEENEEYP